MLYKSFSMNPSQLSPPNAAEFQATNSASDGDGSTTNQTSAHTLDKTQTAWQGPGRTQLPYIAIFDKYQYSFFTLISLFCIEAWVVCRFKFKLLPLKSFLISLHLPPNILAKAMLIVSWCHWCSFADLPAFTLVASHWGCHHGAKSSCHPFGGCWQATPWRSICINNCE